MSRPPREADPGTSGVHPSAPQVQPPKAAIAISATFTAEALEPTLAFWLRELQLDFKIRFAPYNQVFQQLLDPLGLLATNRNGLNVVLVRFEDWARFRHAASLAELESEVRRLESALRSAAGAAGSPVLVCVCPASPEFLSDQERAQFVRRSEESLRAALRDTPNGASGHRRRAQPPLSGSRILRSACRRVGPCALYAEFFAALGTMIARKLHTLRGNRHKVIALDCDDTLWSGVCGEDGPHGVRLEAGHRALQEFMLAQRETGMLLCLCSKNNPEDVYETFRAHPEMPLRMEHFAASRLNWEPKSASLRSLADELHLAPESFVLVDNSATECAEVRAGSPEILTIALPAASSGDFAGFLNHLWVFDQWSATEEDRHRAALYAREAERTKAEQQSASLEEFLASLNLEIHIAPMSPDQLPRVAQLTHRTNQMNFTSIRRSEIEIQNLLHSGDLECLTVDVSDRFGSYGLTGVILFRAGRTSLTVDSFLLSCRALGRGVEHRMLARIGQIACDRGLHDVEIPFVPAARNRPAEALLSGVGAQFAERTATGSTFRFPARYLAALRYSTGDCRTAGNEERRGKAADAASSCLVDYTRIARELRTPAQILEAVRRGARRQPAIQSTDAPRTDLERQLAQMWANLLGLPAGGHPRKLFRSRRPFPAGRATAFACAPDFRYRSLLAGGL